MPSQQQANLFSQTEPPLRPLAERLRPKRISEIIGQDHLLGQDGWLHLLLQQKHGNFPNLILWGEPGVGKTSLAHTLATELKYNFVACSAISAGVKEIRDYMTRAKEQWQQQQTKTLLFLDEIHRFNKAQQDTLLHDLEIGTVTLIGATTENPAFSLNNALLSRAHVVTLAPLDATALEKLIERALQHPDGLKDFNIEPAARDLLINQSHGDARFVLSLLEAAANLTKDHAKLLTKTQLQQILETNPLRHDRSGDGHYDVVSAWIKTMRGSDVDAAIYWAARLWEAGEDRRFLFRRLIIFSAEDIGNADPQALPLMVAAADAFERVGEAESWIIFAQAVTYASMAEKSNASYQAFRNAKALLHQAAQAPVPLWLRNAPTALAKSLHHGEGYIYPHDQPGHIAPAVRYFPETMLEERLYFPSDQGYEKNWQTRLTDFFTLRAQQRKQNNG